MKSNAIYSSTDPEQTFVDSIYNEDLEFAETLLKSGLEISNEDFREIVRLASIWALRCGNFAYFEEIGVFGRSFSADEKMDILAELVCYNCLDGLKYLLCQKKWDPNLMFDNNRGLLHVAAVFSNKEMAKFLISTGVEKNSQDIDGRTPLHDASFNCDAGIVEVLLESEADMQIADKDGLDFVSYTLMIDGEHDEEEIMPVIDVAIRNKFPINRLNAEGRNVLFEALACGHQNMAKMLILEGASAKCIDSRGGDIISEISTDDEIGLWLLEEALKQGANPNFINIPNNMSLLAMEEEWGTSAGVDILKKYGARHSFNISKVDGELLSEVVRCLRELFRKSELPGEDIEKLGAMIGFIEKLPIVKPGFCKSLKIQTTPELPNSDWNEYFNFIVDSDEISFESRIISKVKGSSLIYKEIDFSFISYGKNEPIQKVIQRLEIAEVFDLLVEKDIKIRVFDGID